MKLDAYHAFAAFFGLLTSVSLVALGVLVMAGEYAQAIGPLFGVIVMGAWTRLAWTWPRN